MNAGMPLRALIVAACATLACLAAPTAATAKIVEVGQAPTEAVPTCPASPCLAVSRTTGYQAKVVDSRAHYVIPANGRIVAFSIRLGSPNKRQISFFERAFRSSIGARALPPPYQAATGKNRCVWDDCAAGVSTRNQKKAAPAMTKPATTGAAIRDVSRMAPMIS